MLPFSGKSGERSGRSGLACNDDQPGARSHFWPAGAKKLTQPPAHPIALDCSTDPAGGDEPHADFAGWQVFEHAQDKKFAVKRDPLALELLKLPRTEKPRGFGKAEAGSGHL